MSNDKPTDGAPEAVWEHMVSRFLGWKLPEDFSPDAGITFSPTFNEHTAHPMRHEPVGTNLLNYQQATVMVQYMLEGTDIHQAALAERDARIDELEGVHLRQVGEIMGMSDQITKARNDALEEAEIAISAELDDIPTTDGFCDWADVAIARDVILSRILALKSGGNDA